MSAEKRKKRPFRASSFFSFNEGGDSEWFINYLKYNIPALCGKSMTAAERKSKFSKEILKFDATERMG